MDRAPALLKFLPVDYGNTPRCGPRRRRLTIEESWALAAHQSLAGSRFSLAPNVHDVSIPVTYQVPGLMVRQADTLTALARTPTLGGRRWWWRCHCGRVVAALFLPPVCALHFRCRHCHRLTYRSVQTHDARVDRYRKNPAGALQALDRGPNKLTVALLILRSRQRLVRGGIQAAGKTTVQMAGA